jgi:hypothetical protein
VVCAFFLSGCATHYTPDQIDDLLARTLQAAQARHDAGMDAEAAVITQAISGLDPSYPGLQDLALRIDPAVRDNMSRNLLGMNRKLRPEVDRRVWVCALLYLPDRILDLIDVVSVGVHLGTGVFADSHLTRALQLAGGFRSTGGLGLHDHRSLGIKAQAEAGITLVSLGAQGFTGALVGTSGVHDTADGLAGLHRPSSRLYQEFRDYWAIGGSATAVLVGAEVDFHPLQLADFLAGFLTIDFLNDDFARTRRLQLDAVEPVLIAEIGKVRRSSRAREAYHAAKASGELARMAANELAAEELSEDPIAENPTTPAPESPSVPTEQPPPSVPAAPY